MDFSRLRTGELIAGIGGLALFGFMFIDWFKAGGTTTAALPAGFPSGFHVPGQSAPGFDAWESLNFVNYVLLVTALLAVKGAGIRCYGKKLKGKVSMNILTVIFGGLSSSLILWRIFDPPGNGDVKLGVFLGLIAAIAISTGGYLAAREDGEDLLEPIGGGRSAASRASSAKSSTPAKRTTTRKASSAKK